MKKIFSIIVCLFMLLMLSGVSFGDTNSDTPSATPSPTTTKGPYISTQLGGVFETDSDLSSNTGTGTIEFKPGFAVGGAGGYNFGMFRIEGEIGYQRNETDKATVCIGGDCVYGSLLGNMSALSFLANGYIDFINSSPVTPYISGGIGVAYINGEIDTRSESDTVFAYQLGAGLAFAINQHMAIDLKYRYFATTNPRFGIADITFASHNVYCGFRFTF
jgi:opacity protein-like surface antigen